LVLTVVIDTNIYISAIFWNVKPREVIDLGRQGKIVIFTSVDIENEIARKLKTKFKLAEEDVNQILLDFSTFTLPVKIKKQLIVVQDDPDDNKFILSQRFYHSMKVRRNDVTTSSTFLTSQRI
jgi:putative PIN family toxin of toxin-antitoxin system